MLSKHTILYSLAKFAPSIAGFICTSLYSYQLNSKEIGTYSIIYVSVLLINSILFQWIRITLLRFFNKYEEYEKKVFFNNLLLIFFSIILLSILSIVLLPLGGIGYNKDEYILGVIWLVVFSIYDINLEFHRSSLNSKKYLIIELSRSVIYILLTTISVYIFKSYQAIIISYIISQIIPLILYKNNYITINYKLYNKAYLIKIIKYGLPLILMLSSSFINNFFDRYLINFYLGKEKVGLYSISYDLFKQIIWLPFLIINLANYPIIIKIFEGKNKEKIHKSLKDNINLLCLVPITIATILINSSNELVNVFLGEPYRQTAILLMPYVIISTIFYGLSVYHYNNAFQFSEKTIKLALIYLTGTVINIVMNIVMLPKFGLIAAAYSSVLSYSIILFSSIILGRKLLIMPHPNLKDVSILLVVVYFTSMIKYHINIENDIYSIMCKSLLSFFIISVAIYSMDLFKFREMINIKFTSLKVKYKPN